MAHPDPLLRPLTEAPFTEAPADESFDRTAAWLRTPRPRRRRPGRALVATAVCVLSLAACTLPVEVEETVGYALLWTTDASAAEAAPTSRTVLGWLGEHGLLGYRVEREPGQGFHYRIAVADADRAQAEGWRSRLATLPDVRDARVEPLEEVHRRPLYAALASELKLIPPAGNSSVKLPPSEEDVIAGAEPILAEHGATWELLEVLPPEEPGGERRIRYRVRWADGRVTDKVMKPQPELTREDVIRGRRSLIRGLHEMGEDTTTVPPLADWLEHRGL